MRRPGGNCWCSRKAHKPNLLRLSGGDGVSVQGALKVETYDKDGETKLSLSVIAAITCLLCANRHDSATRGRSKRPSSFPRRPRGRRKYLCRRREPWQGAGIGYPYSEGCDVMLGSFLELAAKLAIAKHRVEVAQELSLHESAALVCDTGEECNRELRIRMACLSPLRSRKRPSLAVGGASGMRQEETSLYAQPIDTEDPYNCLLLKMRRLALVAPILLPALLGYRVKCDISIFKISVDHRLCSMGLFIVAVVNDRTRHAAEDGFYHVSEIERQLATVRSRSADRLH